LINKLTVEKLRLTRRNSGNLSRRRKVKSERSQIVSSQFSLENVESSINQSIKQSVLIFRVASVLEILIS